MRQQVTAQSSMASLNGVGLRDSFVPPEEFTDNIV